jgi:hypothetical protein
MDSLEAHYLVEATDTEIDLVETVMDSVGSEAEFGAFAN